MSAQIVGYRDLTPSRWLNGGGFTREIAADSAGGQVNWRISIAEVALSGAFSAFPGVDRVIMLLPGPGMTLTVAGTLNPLVPLRPFAFSGGVDTLGEVTGPTLALNVMARCGAAAGSIDVIDITEPTQISAQPHGLVFVLSLAGTVTVDAGNGTQLAVLDGATTPDTLTVAGHGTVAVARVAKMPSRRRH